MNNIVSENTRITYRSGCDHFERWGAFLPTDVDTLKRYLIEQAQILNTRTLELRLSAISKWHIKNLFDNPAVHPEVKALMTCIKKAYKKPRGKTKALMIEDMVKIIKYLREQTQTRKIIRDMALIQLGFIGAFRRSELVGFCVEDIQWVSEGIIITIHKSKTDQAVDDIKKCIPMGSKFICPVTSLKNWLDNSAVISGPVFRSVNRWDDVGDMALYPGSVSSILKHYVKILNLGDVSEFSSHSLRSGMVASALHENINFREIRRACNYKSNCAIFGYMND